MRGRSGSLWLGAAMLAGLAAAAPAWSEPKPADADGSKLKLHDLESTIDATEAKRTALARDIETYRGDRARFQAALIGTTSKVTESENKVADAEARLAMLSSKETAVRVSLDSRRAVLSEVLAALQRMGRKPPPALLIEPEDVLKAIRASMLLGAVLPGMRAEVDALLSDLGELKRTRQAIEAERKAADSERQTLGVERQRLTALVDARQIALGKAQGELDAERDKAKQLAGQATSLKELIGRMEGESMAAANAAAAARRSDETLAAIMPEGAARPRDAQRDPARLAPAVTFASTKGELPFPVSGSLLRRFGEDDGLGSAEKGDLVETHPMAVVAAPADSWIAYAGPYRSFGQLLILNAGGGYYIVLAGMDRVNVSLGQFVLAGEPVAVMGDGSVKTAAAMALGVAQPVLYVEFRKDGAAIDPGPWWARPEVQKVRG